jgi:hypothetical protein
VVQSIWQVRLEVTAPHRPAVMRSASLLPPEAAQARPPRVGEDELAQGVEDVLARLLTRPPLAHGGRDLANARNDPAVLALLVDDGQVQRLAHDPNGSASNQAGDNTVRTY